MYFIDILINAKRVLQQNEILLVFHAKPWRYQHCYYLCCGCGFTETANCLLTRVAYSRTHRRRNRSGGGGTGSRCPPGFQKGEGAQRALKHRALLYTNSAEVCVSYCTSFKPARIPNLRNKHASRYIFNAKLNVLQKAVRISQETHT